MPFWGLAQARAWQRVMAEERKWIVIQKDWTTSPGQEDAEQGADDDVYGKTWRTDDEMKQQLSEEWREAGGSAWEDEDEGGDEDEDESYGNSVDKRRFFRMQREERPFDHNGCLDETDEELNDPFAETSRRKMFSKTKGSLHKEEPRRDFSQMLSSDDASI